MNGPTNVLISDCIFSNVSNQAIFSGITPYQTGPNVRSVNNIFKTVGNTGNAQTSEIITFGSAGNVSEGDTFSRIAEINSPTFSSTSSVKSVINGPALIAAKNPITIPVSITNRQSGIQYLVYPLANTTTGQTIVIDYIFTQPFTGVSRMGKLTVITNGLNNPLVRDEYNFVGPNDGFIYFVSDASSIYTGYNALATIQNNAIVLKYRSDINYPGTLTFTYTVKQ